MEFNERILIRPLLLLIATAPSLVLHAEDRAQAALLTAPEWLMQSVSLNDAPQAVMARFRADASRIRIGNLTTFAFYADPVGVTHSHADHNEHDHAHGAADPCNAQPAWSVQVRDGRLQSIIASPATPASLDAVDKHGLLELAAGQVGGIGVRVWAVDHEQALVAIGVDPEARTAGQWVLIRRSLLPEIYPEVAALIRPVR
jgi:hypothetical protein